MEGCLHCGLPVPTARRGGFCCFGCRFAARLAAPGEDAGDGRAGAPSTLLLRLGLSIFLALNVMAVSWGTYSREVFGTRAMAEAGYGSLTGLFSFLAFFLCTGVVVLLGLPMVEDALLRPQEAGRRGALRRLAAIFTGGATTQLLVVIGVLSAYALSVVNLFRGEGSLYFDTAATVLVVVSLGSYLEARAKRRAVGAAGSLLTPLPERILVRCGDGGEEVTPEELEEGDVARILPGECVAFDGEVVEGRSHLDEARLVGEPHPRPVEPGSRVLAGTLNLEGLLWARVEAVGSETVLAETRQTLETARGEQPPIQRLADRVAAVFVPSVILLAVAVFTVRAADGQAADGLFRALSVLLISCPCALGLAAPLASWNALERAADAGILVDRASTLERAAGLDRLFFDKTGTLTEPRLRLSAVETTAGVDPGQALRWAAALETASPHPLARAFLEGAGQAGIPRGAKLPEASDARIVAGLGVEGTIQGRRLRLGSPAWARELGVPVCLGETLGQGEIPREGVALGQGEVPRGGGAFGQGEVPREGEALGQGEVPREGEALGQGEASGQGEVLKEGGAFGEDKASSDGTFSEEVPDAPGTRVLLMDDDRILARFTFEESLRPEASTTVESLRNAGLTLGILSGDRTAAARRIGAELRIEARGDLLPRDKVQALVAARGDGSKVAMVGDGINDAPVLAAADVGVALGSASELARRSADVRLLGDDLSRLPLLLAIAQDARRRIRANLAWAFGFNSAGIVLAAAGLLSPVFSALAMVTSSLIVVRISSRAGLAAVRSAPFAEGDDARPADPPLQGIPPAADAPGGGTLGTLGRSQALARKESFRVEARGRTGGDAGIVEVRQRRSGRSEPLATRFDSCQGRPGTDAIESPPVTAGPLEA